MKKRLFNYSGLMVAIVAGAVAIGFSSCKKDTPVVPAAPSLTILLGDNEIPSGKELDQVAQTGGSATIKVESTRGWTVTVPAADTWLTAETKSGSANKGTPTEVKLTAIANSGAARTSTVTISTTEGNLSKTVIFRQDGAMPVGDITIADIRAMYSGTDVTITDDKTLVATIISDANPTTGGNSTSKKNLVIQDATAGIVVRLAVDPDPLYVVNEVVSVQVKDLKISHYGNSVQLTAGATNAGVPAAAITKTGNTNVIAPASITAAQLLTGDYESTLVAVSGVQFLSDAVGKNINDANFTKDNTQGHSTVMLETQDGKSIGTFVSKYAGFFATQTVPEGSGVMKGIAGISFDEFQIQPRTATDYDGMTEARFAEAPRFGVSSEAVSVIAAGGDATVDVTGNVDWTVTVKDGEDNLVSAPAATGSDAGTITLDFKENTDTENTKVVTITVATTADVATKSFDVVFTQAAALPAGEKVAVFNISEMGLVNEEVWGTRTEDGITITAGSGGNSNIPKYYTSGASLRTYKDNTLTFTGGEIISIVVTNRSGSNARIDGFTASPEGLSGLTWTGSATSVVFTTGPATTEVPNPQHHFTSFTVTYK